MKILIADDHPLYTEGLKNFLSDEFKITEIVEDGKSAVDEALKKKPDVILMDIEMPGLDGIKATRIIKKKLPEVKIIILTSFGENDNVIRAIKAGASGYLLKSLDGDQLIRNLKDMEEGKNPFSPGIQNYILEEIRDKDDKTNLKQVGKKFSLTERQLEVVALLMENFTYEEIANELFIAERTVKYHMKEIKEKMGVQRKREVIKKLNP
ncbi:MAG: response regulator [Bacillota bacterium]